MTTSADRRGWGPGWPHNNSAKMVTVRAKISGAVWLMDYRVAPIKQFIVDQIEATGHLFDYGPQDVNDDWGYANRPIRGTKIPSNHSWGLATDDDAQNYPQGQTKLRPLGWIIDLHAKYRFDNGVLWARPDPMHWEFNGTPADAAWLVASLAAHAITLTQPPLPVTAPIPTKFPTYPPASQEDTDMPGYLFTDGSQIWLTDGLTKRVVPFDGNRFNELMFLGQAKNARKPDGGPDIPLNADYLAGIPAR